MTSRLLHSSDQSLLKVSRQTRAPQVPEHKVDLLTNKEADEPRLADYVEPRSWMVFELLNIDVNFLAILQHFFSLYGYFWYKVAVLDIIEKNYKFSYVI